jgi:small subunit ribosomal protein S3
VLKSDVPEDDRRPRRNARPGAPAGRGRPGGDRGAPRTDKPADAGAPGVKRVRKAAPAGGEGKGE